MSHIAPIPCLGIEGLTVATCIEKIKEELAEVEQAYRDLNTDMGLSQNDKVFHFAEELVDLITASTTCLAVAGASGATRQWLQQYVNDKNARRGYHGGGQAVSIQ